ncbi:BspA family leucine-rich repeat surface protein [[Acholeplasma] multilocale]|uniref:BspA family leucine-rich repeat surface protein n=1 Tax=[Acholeplasma] multilocale TaxID=264638 RepID=UPI00068458D9|nr:BspA family leucine-rich repeat surface protein [[Acholeplasma] multilocale]
MRISNEKYQDGNYAEGHFTTDYTFVGKANLENQGKYHGEVGITHHWFDSYDSYWVDPSGQEMRGERMPFMEVEGSDKYVKTVTKIGYSEYGIAHNIPRYATDLPKQISRNITSLDNMFRMCIFNGDITDWDTSNITDMQWVFSLAMFFNQDISRWDTSKVTNMEYMFYNATSFKYDLSSWDVSKVTNMRSMFLGAINFDFPIGVWDVSKVTDMAMMFWGAFGFTNDLSMWEVDNVSEYTDFDKDTSLEWTSELKPTFE